MLKAAKEQADNSDDQRSDVSREEYNSLMDQLKQLQDAKDVKENTQSESGSRRSRSKEKRREKDRKADRYKLGCPDQVRAIIVSTNFLTLKFFNKIFFLNF